MRAGTAERSGEGLVPALEALGLRREPFGPSGGPPEEPFLYLDPAREQLLDLLRQVLPYSELVLLTGPEGVGKSTLLARFLTELGEGWRVCRLEGAAHLDPEEAARALARCLGLAADLPEAELTPVLGAQLRALRQQGLTPLVAVDATERLPEETLAWLGRLLEAAEEGVKGGGTGPAGPSLLLCGGEEVAEALDRRSLLTPLAARVAHRFRVEPLDAEHTAAYVLHRLRAAGAAHEGPFGPQTLARLHQASGGLPARIDELAHGLLHQRLTLTAEGGGGAAAARRWVGLGVLAAAGLLLYLLGGEPQPPEPPPQAQERAADGRLPRPAPSAPAPAHLPPPARQTAALEPAPTLLGAAPRAQRGPAASPAPGGEAPRQAAPRPEAPAPRAEAAEPAPAPRPGPMEQARGKAPRPPAPPTERPRAAAPPPEPPRAAAPAPQRPRAAPSRKPSTPEARPARAPGPFGPEWLRRQPSDSYTLQLVALSSRERALAFVRRRGLARQAAVLPVRRGGRVLYAVVYGVHPTRGQAQAAARRLQGRLDLKPWVRRVGSLKAALALEPASRGPRPAGAH